MICTMLVFVSISLLFSLLSSTPIQLERRVYTTNAIPGFRKDTPSLWPPGLGGADASERVIVDVGANDGHEYTLQGFQHGHTVFAFEPSPVVSALFRNTMKMNNVPYTEMALSALVRRGAVENNVLPATYFDSGDARVYFLRSAVSNVTGVSYFHQSPCTRIDKCGKTNHIINARGRGSVTSVPTTRLDDLDFPVDLEDIWLLKIDVEGYEKQVIQGGRKLLSRAKIPFIAVEFSPNGRHGIEWGVSLLEELRRNGYVCHHLRGFGACQNSGQRSPSLKCNYPFPVDSVRKAPTFEQYTETFASGDVTGSNAPMSDLMCVHRDML